jgi:hypothetical protein
MTKIASFKTVVSPPAAKVKFQWTTATDNLWGKNTDIDIAEEALLGTLLDHELVAVLKRPVFVVAYRRRQLDSTPFDGAHRPWTRAEEELIETMSDRGLARRLNRTVVATRNRRIKKGIPTFNPQKHDWTPEDDKLLGTRPTGRLPFCLASPRAPAGTAADDGAFYCANA